MSVSSKPTRLGPGPAAGQQFGAGLASAPSAPSAALRGVAPLQQPPAEPAAAAAADDDPTFRGLASIPSDHGTGFNWTVLDGGQLPLPLQLQPASSVKAELSTDRSVNFGSTGNESTPAVPAPTSTWNENTPGLGATTPGVGVKQEPGRQATEESEPSTNGRKRTTSEASDSEHLRPHYSYAELAALAIRANGGKAQVADIYSWIEETYPLYKSGVAFWKNCIRHNLSMKECFTKQTGEGRSFWTLEANVKRVLPELPTESEFDPNHIVPKKRRRRLSSETSRTARKPKARKDSKPVVREVPKVVKRPQVERWPSSVEPAQGKAVLMDAAIQTDDVVHIGPLKNAKKRARKAGRRLVRASSGGASRLVRAPSGGASRLVRAASGGANGITNAPLNYPYASDDISVFSKASPPSLPTQGLLLEHSLGPSKGEEQWDIFGKTLIELDGPTYPGDLAIGDQNSFLRYLNDGLNESDDDQTVFLL